MKAKWFRFSAVVLAIVMLLSGCSEIVTETPEELSVYATFFPIYALTDRIVDNIENRSVHCLIQPQDDCLRSYSLSDWDLYMLDYAADILLAGGNGLEGFGEQLESIGESKLPVAEIMYGLDMKEFENATDEESHFSGPNPHLYMSIDGAAAIAENISATMSLFDAENAEKYDDNLNETLLEIDKVRQYIEETTEVCSKIRCAVMNEALFYTAKDCNLNIAAWYERENGEMLYGDALIQCVDDFKKNAVELVLIEEQAPKTLVESLEQAGFKVIRLNTLSTCTESDGFEGYLDVLKTNASLIAEACTNIMEEYFETSYDLY